MTEGQTALGVILYEMQRWALEEGRWPVLIRCSRALLETVAGEAEVWPIGPRVDGYLSRVPGVPADWLMDPTKDGLVCMFEGGPL